MNENNQRLMAPSSAPSGFAEIQQQADIYSSLPPGLLRATSLRVAFLVNSPLAWRMVESQSTDHGSAARRKDLMYFETAAQVLKSIQERIEWRRADARFVEEHLSTPGGFPGITADWVPSWQFGGDV
jgi:hypothetical protein